MTKSDSCSSTLLITGFGTNVSMKDFLGLAKKKRMTSVKMELRSKVAIDPDMDKSMEVTAVFESKEDSDKFVGEHNGREFDQRFLTFHYRPNPKKE